MNLIMKKTIINTLFNVRALVMVSALFGASCSEDTDIDYSESSAIKQEVPDAYLQILTPVVGFQAGTESYTLSMYAINATKDINKIMVYSVFTDAATGLVSDEVELTSFPVSAPNRSLVEGTLTYADLKDGVLIDGDPLPENEADLKVGSGWKLRFEGVRPNGDVVPLKGNINIAVLSRFAGMYKVLYGSYLRFDGISADYTGQERFIGSVDETTFSYNDYWGSFAWTGNQFNFTIDFDDNSIYVPILVDGLFSGTKPLRCGEDTFFNQPCEGSNILIPNEVDGKHKINLTYGYLGTGGNREFHERLEKIVE